MLSSTFQDMDFDADPYNHLLLVDATTIIMVLKNSFRIKFLIL